jgi:integrase
MRVRRRGKKVYYFYDKGGKPRKEIALGHDYALAVKKWAELELDANPSHAKLVTFRYVAERYQREIVPSKASRTQRDNLIELAKLYQFFDSPPAPLDKIQPIHVRQYLDWRQDSPVRANREKALFSHIWNKAREWGYTLLPNPCQGVKGFKETGRDIYVEDTDYKTVWDLADQPLRDAMDLAYLTGQRPADILKFQETDIRDEVLLVIQNKTKKKLRIAVTGQLKEVIDRILARKRTHKVRSLVLICNERGEPVDSLRAPFKIRPRKKWFWSMFPVS